MKKYFTIQVFLILFCIDIYANTNNLPLVFTENKGQIKYGCGTIATDILYSLKASDMRVDIKANGIYYNFFEANIIDDGLMFDSGLPHKGKFYQNSQKISKQYIIKMQLSGANTSPEVVSLNEQPYFENIYTSGVDIISKAKSFSTILIKEIYPGIDWKIYIKEGKVKYDFVVSAGGDHTRIKMNYSGADLIDILEDGSLSARCPLGEITEQNPITYKLKSMERIQSRFVLKDGLVTFDIAEFSETIVIDPEVVWCTYFGGGGYDTFTKSVMDKSGNIYFGGQTESIMGLTSADSHSPQYNGGLTDALVVCMDSTGNRLWATYFGGSKIDGFSGIAIDQTGYLYLDGATSSTSNIATPGAYQTTYGGGQSDIMLAKFTTSGKLIWSTYIGGPGIDGTWRDLPDYVFNDIVLTHENNIFIGSLTTSVTGISTLGSHQESSGGGLDACIFKFDTSGMRIWGSYYGGSGDEYVSGMAYGDGNIYFSGGTQSTTKIASPGSYQITKGNDSEGYIVKMSDSGTRIWGTYYGANGYDEINNLQLDGEGSIYCIGTTESNVLIATQGTDQPAIGGNNDGFLIKFDTLGQRRWGTYIGGSQNEYFFGLGFDIYHNVFVSGMTTGSTTKISTSDAFQPIYGGGPFDAVVAIYDRNGQKLYGSYYGGGGNDRSWIITPYNEHSIYLCGETSSTNLSKGDVFQTAYGGGISDVFLLKLEYPSKLDIDKANLSIEIYLCPNPAFDFIYIEGNNVKLFDDYKIYDINGKIHQYKIMGDRIDVSNLIPGNYIISWNDKIKSINYYSKFTKM